MKDVIARKYRLVVKTIGYIGWSLFWLLIWDVLVTIDFMLFLNSKFTLPLIPLTPVSYTHLTLPTIYSV